MLDFTMLAKAMDIKREEKKDNSVNAASFLESMDNIYSGLVDASMCGGATSYLEDIEKLHRVVDFEEISIPTTLMEMLDREE